MGGLRSEHRPRVRPCTAIAAVIGALVLLVAAAAVAGRTTPVVGHGSAVLDFGPLLDKSGVYALSDPRDVASAAAAGIGFTLTAYPGSHQPLREAVADHGMYFLDSYLKDALYAAECPHGAGSCVPLLADARRRLLTMVRRHVQVTRGDPRVAGYYLTDDYYGDFRGALGDIYSAMRRLDPSKPSLCGFYLPLAYTPARSAAAVVDQSVFDQASVNYSPQWCDAVVIYAYGPFTASPLRSSVEWDMASTLPHALAVLRARGWNSARQPLIGTPQAFGYAPHSARADGEPLAWAQYVNAPTTTQLATQVAAFCRFGARSILAYAWNDGARGNISELFNSAPLRAGIGQGVRICRAMYWPP